jgi:hypothetical protein
VGLLLGPITGVIGVIQVQRCKPVSAQVAASL